MIVASTEQKQIKTIELIARAISSIVLCYFISH